METQTKYALTPIAGAIATALAPAHQALAQDTDDSAYALEEIIVTATKRSVSLQDVPATVMAITQESLEAMGAKGMEDYARFVPSVNVVTYGGSSSTVVFRGAITGPDYIGQATSSVYLDEISITQTGSQPSIRAVDVMRIEALSGPQGTLYGSDAQAGTMRILTNQPKMNEFEVIFDGELRTGKEPDNSYRGSLVFNLPLVEDRLAMRIVGYNDLDGGYVNNVYGHTSDWHGLGGTNRAPAQWGTLDNAGVLEDDWNDNEVTGGRVHLRWEMNDDWATTFSYHYQKSDQGASNYFDPFVGDLEVIRFHDEYRTEEFKMASLVVEGDLQFAQLTAAVSYFEREWDGLSDITTYAHYWAAAYCHDTYYTLADLPYYWANPDTGYIVWWPVYCQGETVEGDFFSSYNYIGADDKLTVEIRLTGDGDTLDWLVGGYYEQSTDSWLAPFATPTTGGRAGFGEGNIYQDSISLQFWEWYHGTALPNVTEQWSSGSHTDWEQYAVFGEVTWHINDSMNLTVGGRYFDRSNENFYWVNHPGRLQANEGFPDAAVPETQAYRIANDGQPFGRSGEETNFVPKVSLSYAFDDDKMFYGLYTQGVRQGGVNRSRGEPFFPGTYESDLMNNYEMGYKSNFAEGKGRFNVTAYYMLWEDYQLSIVDPSQEPCPNDPDLAIAGVCGQPWQQVIANLGEAHISGVNVELDYSPSEDWVFGLNYEKMEAETDTAHDLNGDGTPNLVKGLRLPLVPSSKSSAWIEYHRPTSMMGAHEMFVRTQWSYTGNSLNILEPLSQADEPNAQFMNPGYTIGDIRAGIVGEDWQLDVFISNVTDERARYTYNTGQYEWAAAQTAENRDHIQRVFTNRPREIGIRFMKRWGD